jgi:hypothetical protein
VEQLPEQYLLIRYVGGHVGIPEADDSRDKLLHGDICGTVIIWQRLLAMISYMDSSFPHGFDGPGDLGIDDLDPRGDIMHTRIASPASTHRSGTAPEQPVLIYRPPAFFPHHPQLLRSYTSRRLRQAPEDYERLGDMLDPADSPRRRCKHVRRRPAWRREAAGVVLRKSPRPGTVAARSNFKPNWGAYEDRSSRT